MRLLTFTVGNMCDMMQNQVFINYRLCSNCN